MTGLWTGRELARVLGAPSAPLIDAVDGVSIDSRTLREGDLFFAIKGETHDGHDHVAGAFEAGASAAVVARAHAKTHAAFGPAFIVDDTLEAMTRLAAAARERTRARVVAVTGSVGKTSVKEMLRVMLSACGAAHASAASYNNHCGVPLTLARLPRDADYAVVEIGMNHTGEITPLAKLARPHAAIVTTIAPVHIEHLGSIEAIADAKAEIFSGVEPHGTAILNRDAPQFERLKQAASARGLTTLNFGASADCDARLIECDENGGAMRVRAAILGRGVTFTLGAPGRHMAENAVGALLAAHALGADIETCAEALKKFSPQRGRGERFSIPTPGGSATVIDESYNANPASMRAALALLGAAKPKAEGRRIAVIGDMLELGLRSAEMHAALATDLIANKVDLLFGAGPLTRALFDAAPPAIRGAWAARSSELTEEVARALREGDVVMVKGSNGSRMGPLVAALRERFARVGAER